MKVPSLSMVPGYQSPKEGERGRGKGEREGEGGRERQGERGRKGHSWVPQHMVHKKPKAENTLNSLFCLAVLFCTSFCNDNNLNADKML